MVNQIAIGGFSTVYKVKNLIDNTNYAIKRIEVKNQNNLDEIANALKEIRLIANIKNDKVTNYNHSWIEAHLYEESNDCINSIKSEDDDPNSEISNSNSVSLNDSCCFANNDSQLIIHPTIKETQNNDTLYPQNAETNECKPEEEEFIFINNIKYP